MFFKIQVIFAIFAKKVFKNLNVMLLHLVKYFLIIKTYKLNHFPFFLKRLYNARISFASSCLS